MITYTPSSEIRLSLFRTPFENSLDPSNRWVLMAELVPWDELAKVFFNELSHNEGRPTVNLRTVLGSLLIKHMEDISDERTIEYIQENIYAQYFVGLSSFQIEPVFAPSLFVEIRKRLGNKGAARLNELMLKEAARVKAISHRRKPSDGRSKPEEEGSESPKDVDSELFSLGDGSDQGEEGAAMFKQEDITEERHRGTLILDATVAPVRVAYPTDTALLGDCRRHSEDLIDNLYKSAPELWPVKPRTYRRVAEKKAVNFSKNKRKGIKEVQRQVKAELNYLKRNIQLIEGMLTKVEGQRANWGWSYAQVRLYWIIQEVYRQQGVMYRDRRRRIDDRIVSVSQPHIRPIKRGKSGGKETEFGPKISASLTEGFLRCDRLSFNAFNEANDLKGQVEAYKTLYGYYPANVLADRIYWTRENRNYLKDRNIRIGGVPLGAKRDMSKYEKEKNRKKNNQRSQIEGKFGVGKTRYGLEGLCTRLPQTTMAQIHLTFLAMNLVQWLQVAIVLIFNWLEQTLCAVYEPIQKQHHWWTVVPHSYAPAAAGALVGSGVAAKSVATF